MFGVCQGRALCDPKTLAEILMTYCHILSSPPARLETPLSRSLCSPQAALSASRSLPAVPRGLRSTAPAASIAGVGIFVSFGGGFCSFHRVSRALVADRDLFSPDVVAPSAIGRAWIDGVFVVDTAARGVPLNDLDTHRLSSCCLQ